MNAALPLTSLSLLTLLTLLTLLAAAPRAAAQAPATFALPLPAADTSATLRSLAPQPAALNRDLPLMPPRLVTPAMRGVPPAAAQARAAAAPAPASASLPSPVQVHTGGLAVNVEGAGANGVVPADPNGAVGTSQYMQSVNINLAIYNKADGALLLGPFATNAVFTGFGGSDGATACRLNNVSGASVLFDKQASRWLVSQIAWAPGNTFTGPYYQCLAVSTSDDATGSYYRYVFPLQDQSGAGIFGDYPKLAVWPDAYYITFVLFDAILGGYRGPRACGLDRTAMLAGQALYGRCADLGTAYGPVLASDLDGKRLPPLGSPNFLVSLDYNVDGSGDRLFLWRFSFGANTISAALAVPVAPFTIACPSTYGGACVQQPAPGETLNTLADRLMYRLAYRNFGDREALVVNHSVQQDGAAADGPLGVRWYELRAPNGAVALYQQGTLAPDADSRWMASIAMDKAGNTALGYSVSGAATAPGIRYTGRQRSEPLGRLEAEAAIVDGGGVQLFGAGLWGNFSALTVDPVDDCAFWYTQQYIGETGFYNWRTRVASFRFRNCTP